MTQVINETTSPVVNEYAFITSIVTSLIIIVAFIVLRHLFVKLVRGKAEILDKDQRRWINRINNTTSICVLIGFILIWAPQLHTFALSLTAVAVALVLTTKELLMCLTGGFLQASTKSFNIGDWINIEGVTGEVMRVTAMTTLIEEIDTAGYSSQFTGRTIQIPNSKFLNANIQNLNFLKNYVYHDVTITVHHNNLNPDTLAKQLHKIAEKYFAPFREKAQLFNKKIEIKTGVDFADINPQIFLKTADNGHFIYTVRFFVPTEESGTISTNITREFLSYIHKKIKEQPLQKEAS